jgi:predicted transcriptional regulator
MERITVVAQARQYIMEHPGCSTREIAAHLGRTGHDVRQMLDRDIRNGSVDTDLIGGVCRYWTQREVPARTPALVLDDVILSLLKERKVLDARQIKAATGKGTGQVWTTLHRMEQRGQVCASNTRPLRWYVPQAR